MNSWNETPETGEAVKEPTLNAVGQKLKEAHTLLQCVEEESKKNKFLWCDYMKITAWLNEKALAEKYIKWSFQQLLRLDGIMERRWPK